MSIIGYNSSLGKAKKAWAAALALVLSGLVPAPARAGFTNFQDFDSGFVGFGQTLAGDTVYRVPTDWWLVASAGNNALNVADNATAVLYIPKGVTLTVNGGNASGTTGAGSGIYVPSSSTLIVTGGGKLIATGGNAANGVNGSNAGACYLTMDWSHGGNGGAGGNGGGGGAPAIGGNGGSGGAGGASPADEEWKETNDTDDYDRDGKDGNAGSPGGDGGTMGSVYLLGTVDVSATGGSGGSGGSPGGNTGGEHDSNWSAVNWYYVGGGGGGGGGAGGIAAPYAIGGGGGGGGGGGSGGNGGLYWAGNYGTGTAHKPDGAGGQGGWENGVSASRSSPDYAQSDDEYFKHGGFRGTGGAKGENGGSIGVYKDSGVSFTGSSPSPSAATTHSAIEYSLKFSDSQRVDEWKTARLGYALPVPPMPPDRPGWTFHGWFTEKDGGGTQYYKGDGTVALELDEYAVAGNLTLYAYWELTDASAADTIAVNGVGLVGGQSQDGDGWHYDGTSGYVTLHDQNKTYVITGNDPAGEFSIYAYASCTVVMSNLTINASSNVNRPPFENNPNSSPVLMFAGTNHLYGPVGLPAIYTYGVGTLTIRDGGGVVYATGGANAPGIGGAPGTSTGSLKIEGGTIEAYGGDFGAGIGSAKDGGFGSITISGGIVKATGKGGASAFGGGAGIGGGAGASVGVIQITGGEVTAIGGNRGSGIGGGSSATGGDISISGGVVNATGGYAGAGIGGGVNGAGGTIAISGGTVTATGGSGASGIGGGDCGPGGTITISGGEVVARGSEHGAGIGGGRNKNGGTITITGGHVDAAGDTLGAGIGGGSGCVPGTISISGGFVMAVGGTNGCAGVGSGYEGWTYAGTGSISISGGTIYASGSRESPDIGRRSNEHNVIVVFTGGAIYVDKEKVQPDPKDGFEKRVFPVDLDIGLPNSLVTEFELGTRRSGFENIYTNDRGILRIWLASSIYSYGIRITMEDGSEHVFCFKVDDDGKVTSSDFLMVNGVIITGDVDQIGAEWTYTKSTSELALLNDATISGVSTNGTFRIVVPDDRVKNLTLQDLTIVASSERYASAVVVSNASCAVALSGDNIIEAKGSYAAGIEVASNSVLTVTGDGSLTVFGGEKGAGIGSRGSGFVKPGKIVIESGTITATGGEKAAGIGGGQSCALQTDNIVVSGGVIVAQGGAGAAGIGGGQGRDVTLAPGAVRICGGAVTAKKGAGSHSDLVKSLGNTLETSVNDYTLVIDGGSVVGASGSVSPRPVDATSNLLYAVTITGLTPGANAAVSSFSGDIPSSYALDGIVADSTGAICLWLPPTNRARIVQVNGKYVETPYPYTNSTTRLNYEVDVNVDAGSGGSDTPPEEVVVDDETRRLVTLAGFDPGETVTLAGLESAGVTTVTMDATRRGFFYLPDGDYAFTANGYRAVVTVDGAPATARFDLGLTVNGAELADLSGAGWVFDFATGRLVLSGAGPYTLAGTNETGKVSIFASVDCVVTYDSLLLDTSSAAGRPPFVLAPGATVTLALTGESTLKGGRDCAALQVVDTATLVVSGGDGSLNAMGGENGAGIGGGANLAVGLVQINGGTIVAQGGANGAGIGSGSNGSGSTIAVSGGSVAANGGGSAAGIGGGYKAQQNSVVISGGDVTANGGDRAAGIGCGNQYGQFTQTEDTVVISGGIVRASGGDSGADIGCSDFGSCKSVAVSGGTVLPKAIGNLLIGKAENDDSSCETVTITGGSVAATSDNVVPVASNGTDRVCCVTVTNLPPNEAVVLDGVLPNDYGKEDLYADANGKAYLWLPDGQHCFLANGRPLRVSVSGADAVAEDYLMGLTVNARDIAFLSGEGWNFDGTLLTLSNSTDYVVSGEGTNVSVRVATDAAVTLDGLSIDDSACGRTTFVVEAGVTATLTIEGVNTLTGGKNCAALQVVDTATLVVSGGDGSLDATGGEYGAGIGGGRDGAVGEIRIDGGTILAQGGSRASGIGSGFYGSGATVAISGGAVAATGGSSGAGIGGGDKGVNNAVTISGGSVTAISGGYASGIGCGDQAMANKQTGDTVVISGGIVRAKNVFRGAEIGCSDYGCCQSVTITGGTILPLEGELLIGRGRPGDSSSCGSVTITGGSVSTTSDKVVPAASNSTDRVSCVTVDGLPPNEAVAFDGLPNGYGTSGIYADADGKVYLWLPNGTYVFYANDLPRTVAVNGADATATQWLTGVTADGVDVSFKRAEGNKWSYDYRAKTLEISDSCVISGANTAGQVNILASPASELSFTISNLHLKATSTATASPVSVASGMVTVCLAGANVLDARSTDSYAGLNVVSPATLVITNLEESATLTAYSGEDAAAIGGNQGEKTGVNSSTGTIRVKGGRILAQAQDSGAGIGSGYRGTSGDIYISGGLIQAIGGEHSNIILGTYLGAGIGGGDSATVGSGRKIAISGGTVRIARGGYVSTTKYAAAIGAGYDSHGVYGVEISGGSVYPVANSEKQNFNQSESGNVSPSNSGNERVFKVTLNGFTPNAKVELRMSGYGTNDISADDDGKVYLWLPNGDYSFTATDECDVSRGYEVHVADAPVDTAGFALTGFTVNGCDVAYLSGDGWSYNDEAAMGGIVLSGLDHYELSGTLTNKFLVISNACSIVMSNVVFRSYNVYGRPGIVDIAGAYDVDMSIFGENIVTTAVDKIAGIRVPVGASLAIDGNGSLTVYAGAYAAGIGGGYDAGCGAITINGGTVTATGGRQGAGIGGGGFTGGTSVGGTDGGDITITGGVVVATGGDWAAGIGGGEQSSGGSVVVTGGRITAQGGVHGPAIGACGAEGTYGDVTLSGGTITTITDEYRRGLGRGRDTVSMGAVTITGGSIAVVTDKVDPAPSNGTDPVYCVTVSDLAANTKVVFDGLPDGYGTKDIYSDAAGCVYLWLPENWPTPTATSLLATSPKKGLLGAPSGTSHTFSANGYSYSVTIDSDAGVAVAEQGEPLPLESLRIDDFEVAEGYLAIRFTAKPATWLFGFSDKLYVRASDTLPMPQDDKHKLNLDGAVLVLDEGNADTATLFVRLGEHSNSRFFAVEFAQ